MKKLILITVLALFVVLVSSSLALAYHVALPDPHQRFGFEPSTGFDSDFCLQCHDIHAAAGDYALMLKTTVTSTCASCHGVYQAAPTGARNPGYPGQESGIAATKSVYEVSLADKYLHEGHRINQGEVSGPYTYASGANADSTTVGGLESNPFTTASADFIPGSGYPGIADYKYLTVISRWNDYAAGADMSGYLSSVKNSTEGLYCASCHSPHGTIRGQALAVGGTPTIKLLSSRPNHRRTPINTAGWVNWVNTGNRWCEACHAQRASVGGPITGGAQGNIVHNHPSEFCLQCHGDNAAVTPDFPHTGAQNLLSEYPDQLCVASCHMVGLP